MGRIPYAQYFIYVVRPDNLTVYWRAPKDINFDFAIRFAYTLHLFFVWGAIRKTCDDRIFIHI